MSLTQKDYWNIANNSYKDEYLEVGREIKDMPIGINYKVIESEDKRYDTGLQAIVVAPVIDGKVDTTNLIMGFRGTDPLKFDGDISADIMQVTAGVKTKNLPIVPSPGVYVSMNITRKIVSKAKNKTDSKIDMNIYSTQFTQAQAFTEEVKAKYPNSNVTTTGHSLGGSLAQYIAAKNDFNGVTFNGPGISHLLPKDIRDKVNSGYFDDKIINYIVARDIVGNFRAGNHIGTKIYLGDSDSTTIAIINSFMGENYHGISHFEKFFDKDGNLLPEAILSIKGFINGEESIFLNPNVLTCFADRMSNICEEIKEDKEQFNRTIYNMDDAVDTLYRDMRNKIGYGTEFDELTSDDLDDIFRELAVEVERDYDGTTYKFYDTSLVYEVNNKYNEYIEHTDEVIYNLRLVGEEFRNKDNELASKFKLKE